MSYWFGLAFQMAVIVFAAFGIMFTVLVIAFLFKGKTSKIAWCDHCGREVTGGEGIECMCTICQECLENYSRDEREG